jgi:hypothetical protein
VEHHARAWEFIGSIRRPLGAGKLVWRISSGASNESNGMSLMAKEQLPSWRIQNGIKSRLIE